MSTEMKQLLALLLLGWASTLLGEARRDLDPCTNGLGALRVYSRYKGCSGSDPDEYVSDLMSSIANNVTVDNLIRLFSNYCSTMFPKLGPCFQKNIENCTSSQQNSLMSLANYTGFACEPNTNRTSHALQHVFSRLTSADLAVNDQCNVDEELQTSMICHDRSLQAIGLSRANFSQVVSRLSMEELAPKLRTYMKTTLNCTVTYIRDNLQNCPAWRGIAFNHIRFHLIPSLLGNNMTLTTADIDTMFRWPVQITG